VVIRNGAAIAQGTGSAVSLVGSYARIERVQARSSDFAIQAVGLSNYVKDNVLSSDFLIKGDYAWVHGNTVRRFPVIEGNHAYVDGNDGTFAEWGLRGSHMKVVGNKAAQLSVFGGSGQIIWDNRIGDLGLNIAGTDHATVRTNEITMRHNIIRAGIRVAGGDFPALNTDVFKNVVTGSQTDGIFVGEGATGTHLWRNRADNNTDDGIDVEEPHTTVRSNRANNNGDLGIEAVSGVFDAGGNRASGNGNPAQCTGVLCR
jgi:hypothetical protein